MRSAAISFVVVFSAATASPIDGIDEEHMMQTTLLQTRTDMRMKNLIGADAGNTDALGVAADGTVEEVKMPPAVWIPPAGDHGTCLAWNMSIAIYEQDWRILGVSNPIIDPAYNIVNKFEVTESERALLGLRKGTDKARLMEKEGDCWMIFQGSDSGGDTPNNGDPTPITKWGVEGLHAGASRELEPLLDQMNFTEIRSACPGKFTVTGHSLGGGLAQMFSVLLTRAHDPLQANITLHELITFGAMSVMEDRFSNPQSGDECFGGAQYWYAQPAQNGGYAVDVLHESASGGKIHEPVRSLKVWVFSDKTQETYVCGTPVPDSIGLSSEVGQAQWLHLHLSYGEFLNCV